MSSSIATHLPSAPVANNVSSSTEEVSTNSLAAPIPFQTVVFSRKVTYNGPVGNDDEQYVVSPLASLVHQTDRNGVSQSKADPHKAVMQSSKAQQGQQHISNNKGLTKFFSNLLGLAEQNEQSEPEPEPVENVYKGIIPPATEMNKKCLVLDLDETLVHSSFKPTVNPDYIIPVEIDGHIHRVYVCKRPGVDEFLLEMGKLYEIVVYTASLSKYADPLLDQLDMHKVIKHRLFREHCVHHEGTYVKDLSLLGRDISQTIIIDNSPLAYMFHPENAIGCTSFIDDLTDRELPSIKDFLINIQTAKDVRDHLHIWTPESAQNY